MTNAAKILDECNSRGISLSLVDGQLRYRAPKGTLDENLKNALKEHKAEVIRILDPDYYNEKIRGAIDGFNSKGINMMDVPASTRQRAFLIEERITEAANVGDREAFLDYLKQWRRCFH